MVSRKVPVHRPSRTVASGGRTASHPGVSNSNGPSFVSPYQPPPAGLDLSGDISALDPNAWQPVVADGRLWRAKIPSASSLGLLNEIIESRGGAQVKTINMFLAAHMHPDDMALMLERMIDPDDSFKSEEYMELYRAVVTLGTARPFGRY